MVGSFQGGKACKESPVPGSVIQDIDYLAAVGAKKLFLFSICHYAAFIQNKDLIGKLLKLLVIVGHDQQGIFFVPIPGVKLFRQLLTGLKIQAGGNLIIKGQLCVLEHDHDDGELLFLPAREGAESFGETGAEIEKIDQLLEFFIFADFGIQDCFHDVFNGHGGDIFIKLHMHRHLIRRKRSGNRTLIRNQP